MNNKYIPGIYRLEFSVTDEGGGCSLKLTDPLTIEKPVGYDTMVKKFRKAGNYTSAINTHITEVQMMKWVTETRLAPVF